MAAIVVQAQAGRGAGVGIGLAEAFDGDERSLVTGLGLLALALVQIPLWATEVGTVLFAGEVRGGGVRHDFGLSVRAADIPLGLLAGVAAQAVVSGGYALVGAAGGRPRHRPDSPGDLGQGRGRRRGGRAPAVRGGGPVRRGAVLPRPAAAGAERVTAKPVALVVSALIFAGIHFELLLLPGLFVAGLLFGYLAQRSGRLGPAIFAHIGFNAATIVALAWSR